MNDREPFVDGINICGYLRGELGLGHAARGYIAALQCLDLPIALNDLTDTVSGLPGLIELPSAAQAENPYRINLITVPAQDHGVVVHFKGNQYFHGHYNIGAWFWELPEFPEEHRFLFHQYDEIWAGSGFIADTLRKVSPIPVAPISPAFLPPSGGDRLGGRHRIDAGEDTIFLFVFDFWSVPERKNALAVIDAFKLAFTPDDPARLIIKSSNSNAYPEYFTEMQRRTKGSRIKLFDGYWPGSKIQDLTAACDVYVSLHRSEGLGLTLLEAMSLGKPVIATGWSGNMDFTTAQNSYPVRYELVPILKDHYRYKAGQIWAEPSIEHAAELMRHVFANRAEASRLGMRASADIARNYSPAAVAELIRERMAAIETRYRQGWRPRESNVLGKAQIDHLTGRQASSLDRIPHEVVQSDVGPLFIHQHDAVMSPILRDQGAWDPAESRVLRRLLAPGMTVIDVGASIGYFTRLCAQAVGPEGRVVAIEPEPHNFAILQANIALVDLENVTMHMAAAGERDEIISLVLNPTNFGDHRAFGEASHRTTVSVRGVRLDNVLNGINNVDVIKIDVQGMDHEVIRGLTETISRCRPTIVVEFFPEGIMTAGASPADVLKLYRSLGYDLTVLTDTPYPLTEENERQLLDELASSTVLDPHVNLLLRPVEPAVSSPDTGEGLPHTASAIAGDPTLLVRPEFIRFLDDDQTLMPLDHAHLVLTATDVGELWTDSRDESVGQLLRATGSHEPQEGAFLRAQIRPGMNVVDVGANIGYFTRMMAVAVGSHGHVVALEPEPANHAILRKNLALGNVGNVIPLRCAAGARHERLRLGLTPTVHGGHHLVGAGPDDEHSVNVDVVPLDDLLEPTAAVDFIKIDIEGYDHLAVAGLRQTIRRHFPVVFVEFFPLAIRRAGFDPAAVLRGYREMGLTVAYELDPDQPLDEDDEGFVSRIDQGEPYDGAQAHTNLILRAPLPYPVIAPKESWPAESIWRPLLQRGIDAFDEGRLEEGRGACLALLSTQHLPEGVRDLVYWTQAEYAQPLTELIPSVATRELNWPASDGETGLAFSPLVCEERFLAFGSLTDGRLDTHHLLTLSDTFEVTEAVTLRDETGLGGRIGDVHPFLLDGAPRASLLIEAPDAAEPTRAGIAEVAAGVFRNPIWIGPRAGYYRHGWTPLATAHGPRFLAWWEPTEVMRFDARSGRFERDGLRLAPRVVERFRSGSPGIAVANGTLLLVNETIVFADGEEATFCRFARLNASFQVTGISSQFFVAGRGSDLATGLVRRADQLIAAFSTEGGGIILATMDLAGVLATLIPIAAPGQQGQRPGSAPT